MAAIHLLESEERCEEAHVGLHKQQPPYPRHEQWHDKRPVCEHKRVSQCKSGNCERLIGHPLGKEENVQDKTADLLHQPQDKHVPWQCWRHACVVDCRCKQRQLIIIAKNHVVGHTWRE